MKRKCPRCNSAKQVIPILYGYPTKESFEKAAAGKLLIGGCIIYDDNPTHFCKTCNTEFKTKRKIRKPI